MKKAQMEIMGLAVILIILAVSIVIALFFILKPKTELLEPQETAIQATSLLNALLETNTNLEDVHNTTTIRDLIKSCYPNEASCQRILKREILDKVFYNKEYSLIIKQEFDQEVKIISGSGCTHLSEEKIVTDPLVLVAAPRMTIILTLCDPAIP